MIEQDKDIMSKIGLGLYFKRDNLHTVCVKLNQQGTEAVQRFAFDWQTGDWFLLNKKGHSTLYVRTKSKLSYFQHRIYIFKTRNGKIKYEVTKENKAVESGLFTNVGDMCKRLQLYIGSEAFYGY